jgi:hypothetical protein
MSETPKKKYEPTTKYLAIKNWEKYQAGKDRKGRDIKAWIKDYCGKDIDDPEYNSLTTSQRYYFDAICRVRGRSGRNVCADEAWIARAVGVLPAERARTGYAILALIERGFLIPTNQEFDSSETESETQSETETETETKVPPPVAAGSPLPSGEKNNPVQGSLPRTTTTPTASPVPPKSTDLRDWSEPIPGCDLDPKRIADCIRYQLDVKKNKYFIERMSRGYVLQEWKRLDADTPEDWTYDPDPLLGEKTIHVDGEDEPLVQKFVRRKPRNKVERKLLQKNERMIALNRKWLCADPCPYGCKEGRFFVSDFPDAPLATQRMLGHDEYCKCIGE